MQESRETQTTVVTGAAGFIGSYLVKELLRRGSPASSIVAVDSLEFFDQRRCCEGFRRAGMTLLSPTEFVERFARGELRAARVFHVGACSSTDETREDYLREVNVKYSRDVWNACVKHGVPMFYASSAATYGAGEQGFSDDVANIPRLHPLNLYGWSKQHFDLFVLEEVKKGKTPPKWAGFKYFNVYGPGEDHKTKQASVLFHARRQFLEKGVLKLFRSMKPGVADGEQKRDFVWVGDVVDVMLAFDAQALRPGIYNVGSGEARSFLDLARATAAAMGLECQVEFIDMPENLRAHYQYWTQAELKNLRAAGYRKPFTSLEEGARKYFQEWSA